MRIRFLLRKVKAIRASDHGSELNPVDLYFTWSLYSGEWDNQVQVAQGFTTGCSIDHGYEIRKGQQRRLNDPDFFADLPDVAEGEERQVTLVLYAWDSDSKRATRINKGYFTNAAAKRLLEIHDEHEEEARAARKEFFSWLKGATESTGELVAPLAGGAAPWVTLASKATPLILDGAVAIRRLSEAKKDDFVGKNRLHFFYWKKNGVVSYKWYLNEGVETGDSTEETYYLTLPYTSDRRDISIDCAATLTVDPT